MRPGDRIGPYRIVDELGHGGMGKVFRAVRADDEFRKVVAIKVLTAAHSPDILQRFRQERQILATLEHPYIARLIDGGTGADGSPYLVMEYIRGKNIGDYCTGIATTDKLRLLRKVCEALHYAHQRLVVHRDIKPSNILVTADGTPKLLDFGIAKLLDPANQSDESMTMTAIGQHMMTPDYASPEQVRGEAVSTATDIYSLGAVMYEALSGIKPHQLKNYDSEEIVRRICHTETKAPSKVAEETNRPALSAELDSIVLKAMQKDPARRYSSIEQFSSDIGSYLEGKPLIARGDSFPYLAAKFLRRNQFAIAAAMVVTVAIVTGAAVSVYQARIARQRFEQVRKLANQYLFEFHNDLAKVPGTLPIREKMVKTAVDYLDQLAAGAGNDAGLLAELGQGYARIGDAQGYPGQPNLGRTRDTFASYEKAVPLLERAARLDPKNRHLYSSVLQRMAGLYRSQSDFAKAADYSKRSLAVADAIAKENPEGLPEIRALAIASGSVGLSLYGLGDSQGALPYLRHQRDGFMKIASRNPTPRTRYETVLARNHLGMVAANAGEFAEAEQAFLGGIAELEAVLKSDPGNPLFQNALYSIFESAANLYFTTGDPHMDEPQKSIEFHQRAIAGWEAMRRDDPNDQDAVVRLAEDLYLMSDALTVKSPAQAAAPARRSLELLAFARSKGPDDQLMLGKLAVALTHLARATHDRTDAQRAVDAWDKALVALKKDATIEKFYPYALALAGDWKKAIATAEANAAAAPNQLSLMIPLADILEQHGDGKRAADLWQRWSQRNVYAARRLGRLRQMQ